jgi:hypothetical protein
MFNKRFALILALMVPFSIFASGCGALTGKKNDEAADKPLTATEVLTKSLQQLRKEKGHSIRVKYESTAVLTETNYVKSTLKIKYEADLSTNSKTNQHLVDDQYEFIYSGPFTQTIQVPDEVKEKAIDI